MASTITSILSHTSGLRHKLAHRYLSGSISSLLLAAKAFNIQFI